MDEFDPWFQPESDSGTAIELEQFEATNACRAVALGAAFGPDQSLEGLQREMSELGLPEYLTETADWSWGDAAESEEIGSLLNSDLREELFIRLQRDGSPVSAAAFLVQLLCSKLERESAAAAGAILGAASADRGRFRLDRFFWLRRNDGFPWLGFNTSDRLLDLDGGQAWAYDPGLDASQPDAVEWVGGEWRMASRDFLGQRGRFSVDAAARIQQLAEWRLTLAMRSSDPITRQFARAATSTLGVDDGDGGDAGGPGRGREPAPGSVVVSAIIHGTWGWKGDWWRPGAPFHAYVQNDIRNNVYSRGAPFSWSGAYSDKQRQMAAEDFCRWASEISPRGVDTILGHSFGGEVAVRAWSRGASVREVVLLSSPVTARVTTAVTRGLRVVDIRLPFDPVLALARIRQRVQQEIHQDAPNLTKVVLPRWQLSHGATHDVDVWEFEDLITRARL